MYQLDPLLMQALGSGAGGYIAANAKPAIQGPLFDAVRSTPPQMPSFSPTPMPEPPKGAGDGKSKGSGRGHVRAGTLGAAPAEGYQDMSQMINPAQLGGMLQQLQQLSANAQGNQQRGAPMQGNPYIAQLMRML